VKTPKPKPKIDVDLEAIPVVRLNPNSKIFPKDMLKLKPVPTVIKMLETAQKYLPNYMGQKDLFDRFLDMGILLCKITPMTDVFEMITERPREPMDDALMMRYTTAVTQFITVYNGFLSEWSNVTKPFQKQEVMEALTGAMAILAHQAHHNFDDIIGAVYMEWGGANKWAGQFFTPMAVAKLNAQVILRDTDWSDTNKYTQENPMTIYDPCCGSGIMFLAAAEIISLHKPTLLTGKRVKFYGQDIDPMCVKMAKFNLLLHGINT
jgi:N-6 DNA Methylase